MSEFYVHRLSPFVIHPGSAPGFRWDTALVWIVFTIAASILWLRNSHRGRISQVQAGLWGASAGVLGIEAMRLLGFGWYGVAGLAGIIIAAAVYFENEATKRGNSAARTPLGYLFIGAAFAAVILGMGFYLGLRWYGLAYVLSFLLGMWLYRWLSERGYNEVPPQQVSDFIIWAAIFGVMLGGRLGHTLFYSRDEFLADPLSFFRVWQGGMSSHGGILGLVLFTYFYARKHHISWTSIGDSLVVVAPIGLFLVRCANFINGELWGKAATVPWAVIFPEAPGDNVPRHPSQIYEALLEGVVLFLLLWVVRTRFRVPRGVLTGLFFIFYAVLRIIGEIFREPDPSWSLGPLSAGQTLSLAMPLIGLGFIIWGVRTQQYEAHFSRRAHQA